MPGNFIVRASQHPFLVGESRPAGITALPVGLARKVLELKFAYNDLKPVVNAPYLVRFDDGTQAEGRLDHRGEAKIENPPGPGKAFFGYDQRDAFPYPERPANPIFGFRPTSPEDAAEALARYAKAEAEYLEDNYFPDEVAAIHDGDNDYDDLLEDYEYDSETVIEEMEDDSPGSHEEVMLAAGRDAQRGPT